MQKFLMCSAFKGSPPFSGSGECHTLYYNIFSDDCKVLYAKNAPLPLRTEELWTVLLHARENTGQESIADDAEDPHGTANDQINLTGVLLALGQVHDTQDHTHDRD